jgi:hypothetical protein
MPSADYELVSGWFLDNPGKSARRARRMKHEAEQDALTWTPRMQRDGDGAIQRGLDRAKATRFGRNTRQN